jgi:hypothetical protein
MLHKRSKSMAIVWLSVRSTEGGELDGIPVGRPHLGSSLEATE